MALELALVGDIHCAWDERDVRWFDAAGYDAVLFTGDLPGLRHGRAYDVARAIAPLKTPAYLIPGNHDATSLGQMVAEATGVGKLSLLDPLAQPGRVAKLGDALGGVRVVGYSQHVLGAPQDAVGLIAARPHAMGGGLSFGGYLARVFGIRTMEASARRLIELVETNPCERLIFLAHNGPTGLGGRPEDIWGRDFHRDAGDWGDPDLRAAVDHAVARGRRVLAVLAGHMHHRTRQKTDRTMHVERGGIHYVNAARVPRIFKRDGELLRHHVRVAIDGERCDVEVVEVSDAAID